MSTEFRRFATSIVNNLFDGTPTKEEVLALHRKNLADGNNLTSGILLTLGYILSDRPISEIQKVWKSAALTYRGWDTTTSWKKELNQVLDGESIISCTRTDEEMRVRFDPSWGIPRGCSFTAWSETRVFFPMTYDGSEWVGSAPRNPNQEHMHHLGG